MTIADVDEQRKKNEKQRQKLCLREKELQRKEFELEIAKQNLRNDKIRFDCEKEKLEKLKEEILSCELPENRDRVRMIYIFTEMCSDRLSNKYADTEYIKGLANIFTGVKADKKQEDENDRHTEAEMQDDI